MSFSIRLLLLTTIFCHCQLPPVVETKKDDQERLDSLEQENQVLKEELKRLKEKLEEKNLTKNTQPASLLSAVPKSQNTEKQVIQARAEQDRLLSQFGKSYVVDLYQAALQETPEDPLALYLAARFLPSPEEKTSLCDKAIGLAPDFGFAYHCRSKGYQQQGFLEKALLDAKKAETLSTAMEIRQQAASLRQKSMKWFSQDLKKFQGEASVTQHFSLGPTTTKVQIKTAQKGLACPEMGVSQKPPFDTCHGLLCLSVEFSYVYDGPSDPYYDQTEICGDALVFSDFSGKTLPSKTDLPCSRLEKEQKIPAKTLLCLPKEEIRVKELRLDLPGENLPLYIPETSPSGTLPSQ